MFHLDFMKYWGETVSSLKTNFKDFWTVFNNEKKQWQKHYQNFFRDLSHPLDGNRWLFEWHCPVIFLRLNVYYKI